MQPSPCADTSSPCVPSLRVSMPAPVVAAFAVASRSSGSRRASSPMLALRGRQLKGVPLPHVRPTDPPGAPASQGGTALAEREARPIPAPAENGVVLRRTPDGKGDAVLATRPFAAGDTVMVGFLIGALSGNDSHATQVGPDRWARHGGLGPKVNHSCDPNCGVRLNEAQAFDFVARRRIDSGQELTFDYAMRNFTIDHFPPACLCGAEQCRGSVTGWKDLPARRKADYGKLVAP